LYEAPLVDDVVQPTADQGGDPDDDEPVPDDVRVLAEPRCLADHDDVRARQAERVGNAVPVQRQRADLDRN